MLMRKYYAISNKTLTAPRLIHSNDVANAPRINSHTAQNEYKRR